MGARRARAGTCAYVWCFGSMKNHIPPRACRAPVLFLFLGSQGACAMKHTMLQRPCQVDEAHAQPLTCVALPRLAGLAAQRREQPRALPHARDPRRRGWLSAARPVSTGAVPFSREPDAARLRFALPSRDATRRKNRSTAAPDGLAHTGRALPPPFPPPRPHGGQWHSAARPRLGPGPADRPSGAARAVIDLSGAARLSLLLLLDLNSSSCSMLSLPLSPLGRRIIC